MSKYRGEVVYLYACDIANLIVLPFRWILDEALDRAYAGHQGRREILCEYGVDLARFSDQVSNTPQFFGESDPAGRHQTVADRFHRAEGQRAAGEKTKTLTDPYQIMQQDQFKRWMLTLEFSIVLMFIPAIIIRLLELSKVVNVG